MIIARGRPGSGHCRPRGITIIELMVVMTGVAAMLGLCAVTIQLLLRVNDDGNSRVATAATLERLARQFRDDAHAGDSARLEREAGGKPVAPGSMLHLALGDGRAVAYEAGDGRVVRRLSGPDKSGMHESYSLGRGGSARFELRDDDGRRFLALIVAAPSGKGQGDPPRPLEVIALQGKDRSRALSKPGEHR